MDQPGRRPLRQPIGERPLRLPGGAAVGEGQPAERLPERVPDRGIGLPRQRAGERGCGVAHLSLRRITWCAAGHVPQRLREGDRRLGADGGIGIGEQRNEARTEPGPLQPAQAAHGHATQQRVPGFECHEQRIDPILAGAARVLGHEQPLEGSGIGRSRGARLSGRCRGRDCEQPDEQREPH